MVRAVCQNHVKVEYKLHCEFLSQRSLCYHHKPLQASSCFCRILSVWFSVEICLFVCLEALICFVQFWHHCSHTSIGADSTGAAAPHPRKHANRGVILPRVPAIPVVNSLVEFVRTNSNTLKRNCRGMPSGCNTANLFDSFIRFLTLLRHC
jgi:hypothetical protein